jgi:uncharacterized membrane protein
MIDIIVCAAVLFLGALATGGLMVNWIGLARAMKRICSAAAYTEFHQATNETFDPYMPIVVCGSIIGGVALASLSGFHSFSGRLAIAGAICYTLVIAITFPTNVRINNLISRWSVQAPPEDWSSTRARWIRFHILRTLISVPAFICFLLAVLLNGT